MRRTVLAMLVVGAAACSDMPASPDQRDRPLTFVRLRSEPYSFTYNSGLHTAARMVIRDAAAWQQAWAELWRDHTPVPALPAIDFERDMVIVAALGDKATGGYSIFVDSVTDTANGLAVQVRTVSPGTNCAVTLAVTQPVDIARVSLRGGSVSYVERAETQDCH